MVWITFFLVFLIGCEPKGVIEPQPIATSQIENDKTKEYSIWSKGWGPYCSFSRPDRDQSCLTCKLVVLMQDTQSPKSTE